NHREHFMLAAERGCADEDAELLHELARVTEVRTADVDTHLLRAFTLDDLPRLEGSVPVEDGERQRSSKVDDGRVLRPVGEEEHPYGLLGKTLALLGPARDHVTGFLVATLGDFPHPQRERLAARPGGDVHLIHTLLQDAFVLPGQVAVAVA